MFIFWKLGLAAALTGALKGSNADSFLAPNARLYVDRSGTCALRFVPVYKGKERYWPDYIRGTLFEIDINTGKDRTVWSAPLRDFPDVVLVSLNGEVVTIRTRVGHAQFRPEHAVVIYGRKGVVIADYDI